VNLETCNLWNLRPGLNLEAKSLTNLMLKDKTGKEILI
jgi:hypothetical protein